MKIVPGFPPKRNTFRKRSTHIEIDNFLKEDKIKMMEKKRKKKKKKKKKQQKRIIIQAIF